MEEQIAINNVNWPGRSTRPAILLHIPAGLCAYTLIRHAFGTHSGAFGKSSTVSLMRFTRFVNVMLEIAKTVSTTWASV